MHLPWILRLFSISSILYPLCILSSANPASLPLTNGIAKHELHLRRRSHPLDNYPAFPNIQPISERSAVSYNLWGNGWASRSYTFFALVPVVPAAAKLSVLYARTVLLSSFPPTPSAGIPTVYHGIPGYMERFHYGGFELRFFCMTKVIPWSFVRTVAARLRENTVMGFTGLHGTVFVHEAAGLVVFVTLTAVGMPVPVPMPMPMP